VIKLGTNVAFEAFRTDVSIEDVSIEIVLSGLRPGMVQIGNWR